FFAQKTDKALDTIRTGQTIARNLTPSDLLGAVHWLVSDSSQLVTGQTIAVDGGTVMHWAAAARFTPPRAEISWRAFRAKPPAPSGAWCPRKPRNSMPSEASKTGPAARSQLLRAYLVHRIAVGAPSARRTATSVARACSSPSGTASETRPMRAASSPVTGSHS